MRQGQVHRPVDAVEVDLDRSQERLGVALLDAPVGGDAGVGEDHVDAAQLRDRGLDRRTHRIDVGDVGLDVDVALAELGRSRLELSGSIPVSAIRAPRFAASAATAAPMPRAAPVMKNTLPSRLIATILRGFRRQRLRGVGGEIEAGELEPKTDVDIGHSTCTLPCSFMYQDCSRRSRPCR